MSRNLPFDPQQLAEFSERNQDRLIPSLKLLIRKEKQPVYQVSSSLFVRSASHHARDILCPPSGRFRSR